MLGFFVTGGRFVYTEITINNVELLYFFGSYWLSQKIMLKNLQGHLVNYIVFRIHILILLNRALILPECLSKYLSGKKSV